jgi:hypothetical protein
MLTIITITKNDLIGIQRNLHSTTLLRQFPDIQQIIIDSSDNEIHQELTNYIKNETNLQLYYQDPQGIAKSFNYGIDLASDGWLWFLNGGDEVYPDLDLDLFTKIISVSSSDIIFFRIEFINPKNPKNTFLSNQPSFLQLWLPIYDWHTHPGSLINRSKIIESGKFNTNFKIAMDTELWFRMFTQNHKVDLISFPIARYYMGGISSNAPETYRELDIIVGRYFFTAIKVLINKFIKLLREWMFYKRARK